MDYRVSFDLMKIAHSPTKNSEKVRFTRESNGTFTNNEEEAYIASNHIPCNIKGISNSSSWFQLSFSFEQFTQIPLKNILNQILVS